ncbi:LysR substrate-binding domain-containing protein [Breoghania sp.]|uniref:LysR substrate-binding domain-containing protein n=1 Tax=Breoghania sp. TaxID=2065378 RepID=UPI002AA76D9A|nr:LysR substrate-binding domain-containing protein [Breoghania sp.]
MARRLPPLNALRAFEAAGRLGGISAAAEELCVTPSAVSRQVRHLEDVVGTPLFEGPKTALRLTEAGRTLLPSLSAAFDQMDAAVSLIADDEDGPLDLSCLGTFKIRWLIPRLHRFQNLHPEIEVRLSASGRPVDFKRDGFDLAIRTGKGDWPPDAAVTPLLKEWVGPVCAPSLADEIRETGLTAALMLHTQTRPDAWAEWSRSTGVAAPEDAGRSYEHFYFLLEAVVSGLGVCIAPWPLVADDIRAGRLVAPWGFVESSMNYVCLKRQRQNRKATRFLAWLQAEAEAFEREAPPPYGAAS